jgi:hypothetical protein
MRLRSSDGQSKRFIPAGSGVRIPPQLPRRNMKINIKILIKILRLDEINGKVVSATKPDGAEFLDVKYTARLYGLDEQAWKDITMNDLVSLGTYRLFSRRKITLEEFMNYVESSKEINFHMISSPDLMKKSLKIASKFPKKLSKELKLFLLLE